MACCHVQLIRITYLNREVEDNRLILQPFDQRCTKIVGIINIGSFAAPRDRGGAKLHDSIVAEQERCSAIVLVVDGTCGRLLKHAFVSIYGECTDAFNNLQSSL